MKKQILNIGKALSRAEQKLVFGGTPLQNEGDINYNCYVTCKGGSQPTWNVFNCGTDADNHCSVSGGWQWCSCWGGSSGGN